MLTDYKEPYVPKKEMPWAQHAFADLKIPLKRRKDAEGWIDSSVKKAILVDKTNNQITLLKNE